MPALDKFLTDILRFRVNVLDTKSRQELLDQLKQHFEPLGLTRFIIVGLGDDSSYVFEMQSETPMSPEMLRSVLHAVADRIEPEDPIELG
jgi:hypothetical protein